MNVEMCKSCDAQIIWAQNPRTLKLMPIDADPAPGGNVRLIERGQAVPSAEVVKPDLAFGRTDLRLSHFATCPHAASHRRKRAAP